MSSSVFAGEVIGAYLSITFPLESIRNFVKMLLHNREDLVNFDQVLGISSFHEKKRPNFSFKLLIFKNFTKFYHLKIKYLTT